MTQHATLQPERWARFTLPQQLLQIGAEMQRGMSCLRPDRLALLHDCYERAMRLVDLTVQVNHGMGLRRELLRWRGVIGELYLREEPDALTHRQAFRALLLLHPETAGQIELSNP